MVDNQRFDIARVFNPACLSYITCIFEDTSDYIFHLWNLQKYNNFTDSIKNIFVIDKNVI